MSFDRNELPRNWSWTTLGDSLYIKGRIGWKGLKKSEYIDISPYRIINGANIKSNTVDWDECGYITKERYLESPEIMLKKNDIVMTKDGTIGKLAMIKTLQQNSTVASGLFVIRVIDNIIDVMYLYYYFSSPYFKLLLNSRIEGSVVPHLYQRDLVELRLPLPPLKEQKAIASVLSSLDEKIEVNNKINQTLEEIAQAIFHQWFVEFEFPNEDGEPYKSSGGEMVESELGMIPKGWEVKEMKDLVDISYGKQLPLKNLTDEGYYVYGGNGIVGYYSDYLYKEKQVIVSCRGAASGKVITTFPFSYVTNNSLILENNKGLLPFEYLKYFSIYREYYDYATGSAQPQITITNLKRVKVVLPTLCIMRKFATLVRPLDKLVDIYLSENQTLKENRDTLLPKLMSGEIRVPLEED